MATMLAGFMQETTWKSCRTSLIALSASQGTPNIIGQGDIQGKLPVSFSVQKRRVAPDVVAIVAGIDADVGILVQSAGDNPDNSNYAIDGGYLQTIEEVDSHLKQAVQRSESVALFNRYWRYKITGIGNQHDGRDLQLDQKYTRQRRTGVRFKRLFTFDGNKD